MRVHFWLPRGQLSHASVAQISARSLCTACEQTWGELELSQYLPTGGPVSSAGAGLYQGLPPRDLVTACCVGAPPVWCESCMLLFETKLRQARASHGQLQLGVLTRGTPQGAGEDEAQRVVGEGSEEDGARIDARGWGQGSGVGRNQRRPCAVDVVLSRT